MDPSMEKTSKPHERENLFPINSPTSNVTNSVCSSNSNGLQTPPPPLTPKAIPRSDSNPYPTTFVQADTSTFKQVVQMLTGSSETAKPSPRPNQDPTQAPSKNHSIPPIRTAQKKQQGFKLYERRNNLKNSLMINTLMPNFAQNPGFSPRKPEILSPSLLDFPSLALSPVTPLNGEDPFDKSSSPSLGSSSEEEKAIAEKKFYLHPSPMTTPRDSQPQLLPLFPVTSPRVTGSSS
ncbi:VQ motif-containing protein 4-like [Juglans regia]|uniref:VQ motif-containing protein 4-like n=2 Tax=Juglans regia TaxID=51240 RepID=A0A2I4H3F3_JUGRE|nr:VQ motif-containing protein 4-like [Juglans regia]